MKISKFRCASAGISSGAARFRSPQFLDDAARTIAIIDELLVDLVGDAEVGPLMLVGLEDTLLLVELDRGADDILAVQRVLRIEVPRLLLVEGRNGCRLS